MLSPEDSGAPGAPAPAPVGATAATGDPPGRGPRLRAWQIASVPLIAAAVVGGVLLFGGSDNSPRSSVPVAQPGGAGVASPGPASFVRRSNFSLALPPGWKSVTPRGGAVYRAVSSDGTADATLWIENDPTLSFGEFIKRSLANLKDLASNATIHQQLPSPTASGTIVQLKGDVPTGNGTAPYLVTLRQSGPYRYYLATSVAPNAPDDARKQAALIHGSFTPEASGNGKGAVSATGPTPGPATGSTP